MPRVCLTALLFLALLPIAAEAAPLPSHAPNHVVIQFKPGPANAHIRGRSVEQATQRLLAQLPLPAGARLEESAFARWNRNRAPQREGRSEELDLNRFLYLHLPPGLSVEQCVARLRNHPLIASVEPDGIGTGGEVIPNDPTFNSQWHHRNNGNPGADIKTPAAWEWTTGSTNVIVAVLDTGLNLGLTEFTNRLVTGYDFANNDPDPTDDQGHGTAVTGTLAANANNAHLVAGVDWQCRIMPIKVLDAGNSGFYSWWAQGVDYAVANGAKVINLSAGGTGGSAPLTTAINNAIAQGVIFVTITHNQNENSIRYPGTLTQAITVGATDSRDQRVDTPSWGSNWGPQIDLVAPGLGIYTVSRFNTAQSWGGTSFAAPQVAGVCALLASLNPNLTQAEAEMILTQSADDEVGDAFDTPGFDIFYGHGRLNAHRAILQGNTNAASIAITQVVRPDPVSVGCELTVSLEVANMGPADATGVQVRHAFHANALFLDAETSQGAFMTDSNEVTVDLGNLARGASASIQIHFQAQAAGALLHQSEVTLDQDDPLDQNNTASTLLMAVTDTQGPDLISATSLPDGQTIDVAFSEAVLPNFALLTNHYMIQDGYSMEVEVLEALPTEDPKVIRLIAPLTMALRPFTLHVSDINDCLGQPMAGVQSVPVTVSSINLIPTGSTWRYLDTGIAPPSHWTSDGFDDAAWGMGPAQLGYGDGDEVTEIGFGPDSSSKHITAWFRRSFHVVDAGVLTNLQVELLRDDGAVIYLNGTEVLRDNMPVGTITPSTLASAAVSDSDETIFFTRLIASSSLVDGTNWLAVEVHQSGGNSSDLSFDLRLTGALREALRPPVFVRHPDSQTVVAGDTVHFKVDVSGDQPMGHRWRKGFGTLVPFGMGGLALTLTNVQASDTGSYTVVATNAANLFPGVLSEAATLVVLADRDGDLMPDDWEELHHLDPDLPGDGVEDADMDGVSNRDEFAGGTDPEDPDSYLKVEEISVVSGAIRLTFQAVSNKTYAIEFKGPGMEEGWQHLRDVASAPTNRTLMVEDTSATAGMRIYRLLTPHQP